MPRLLGAAFLSCTIRHADSQASARVRCAALGVTQKRDQRAFPLPKPDQGDEQHLRVLLDALRDMEAEEP